MLLKSLYLSLAALALSGPALASKNFCGEISDCRKIRISNEASVLVTSVTVTQQPTDGACTKDQRHYGQNLRSANKNLSADAFNIFVNPACKYKIKYKTTPGCIGDKTGYLTSQKFADLANYVALKKACGSLKVKVS